VHTSAKARLSWLSVVRRWCNDVTVAMAMPASACPALQRRAAQSVDTTFRISQQWQIQKTILVFERWPGSPPKFNRPIANLPCKLHSNPFESFCAKLLTDKQTNNDDYIKLFSLAEVIITFFSAFSLYHFFVGWLSLRMQTLFTFVVRIILCYMEQYYVNML